MAQFTVDNRSVEDIVGWVKSKEVAIPEIQRPFVWDSAKVRDLMDSLYRGYPIGHIIVWKKPNVKLRDGSISSGKNILIDGQQRVTAIQAAIVGLKVTGSDYKKKRIKIAFNPIKEAFEVANPAIQKNSQWIPDISEIFATDFDGWTFVDNYCKKNGISGEQAKISKTIGKLKAILNVSLAVTNLNDSLSIDEVTDIFIRINSEGVVLSQADFAMSTISSDSNHNGNYIRKMIDYFCHFMKSPTDYETIAANDTEFVANGGINKIKWAVAETEDIYVPDYKDTLRVAFTHKFKRGKLADLVSLLSGRDFEKRENFEYIAEESFDKLHQGVEDFVNETNFKRYIMIVQSTGIISHSLIRSKSVLNFGYILYLTLKDQKIDQAAIERMVRKWIVLSMLTGRYSGSPESMIDYDIKQFTKIDPEEYIAETEKAQLSDAFWNVGLIQRLNTPVASSPYFMLYLMAQIKSHSRGFLSKNISVESLISNRGDIHHIFPKKYLRSNGINQRGDYNQIANYAYTQSEINIQIKDAAPNIYMAKMKDQVSGGEISYGNITDKRDLRNNLAENCIPEDIVNMDINNYQDFLAKRRVLMADFIHKFYDSL